MYYLTKENFPVKLKGQKPNFDWVPILKQNKNENHKNYLKRCEIEYKRICKERNNQIAADQARLEEEMKPIRERWQLIMARALRNAEKELIEEKIIKKMKK